MLYLIELLLAHCILQELRVHFTTFDVEYEENCLWDSVTVYAANSYDITNIQAVFCGQEIPDDIYTTVPLLISFFSDRNPGLDSNTGFRAEVQPVDEDYGQSV